MADSSGGFAPRGPVGVWRALRWSLQGLRSAWQVESSFRLEVYLFVPLSLIALWYGQTPIERIVLIGSLLLVIAAELLNSSIEAVIARYGDEHHELTGRAKDMGSAAVFVLMLNVVMVWGVLLGPRYLPGLLG